MEVQAGRCRPVFIGLCRLSGAAQVLVRGAQEPVGLRPVGTAGARRMVAERLHSLLRLSLEQPQSLLQNIITQKLYNLPADYWDTYPQKVAAITAADVQNAAKKYIDMGHLQVVGLELDVAVDARGLVGVRHVPRHQGPQRAPHLERVGGLSEAQVEDLALIENQGGPIMDRTRETLNSGDMINIHQRSQLIKAARALQEGKEPAPPHHPEHFLVRSGAFKVPADMPLKEAVEKLVPQLNAAPPPPAVAATKPVPVS